MREGGANGRGRGVREEEVVDEEEEGGSGFVEGEEIGEGEGVVKRRRCC